MSLWETEYFQYLAPVETGHPVRRFTESTFGKSVLDRLHPDQQQALIAAYDLEMTRHYPLQPDGGVAFPFRRVFFTLIKE